MSLFKKLKKENGLHRQLLLLASIAFLSIATSCSNSEEDLSQPSDIQNEINPGQTLDLEYFYQYGELMFTNEEPREVYLSKKRAFYGDKMVTADVYANSVAYMDTLASTNFDEIDLEERKRLLGQVRLFNGVAADIDHISVYCTIVPLNQTILVAKLDVLPAHYTLTFPFNLATGTKTFTTIGDEEITVNLDEMNPADFSFYIKTTDTTFNKLNTIKVKTLYVFKDYDWPISMEQPVVNWDQNSWGRTLSVHCRRYTTSLATTNYFVSQDYFVNMIADYQDREDVYLHAGDCEEDANGNRILLPTTTLVDIASYFENYRTVKQLNLGVCDGVSGLGGGAAIGVSSNQVILEAGAQVDPGDFWAHEMGHVLGYGHVSNMTYGDNLGAFVSIWRDSFGKYSEDRVLVAGEVMYPQEYEFPIEETLTTLNISNNNHCGIE